MQNLVGLFEFDSRGGDDQVINWSHHLTNQRDTRNKGNDQQKKKSLKPNLVQDVEMKLLDSLACVVLSTKNARQSWAMEMLVKSLRQIIIEQPQTNHPMFEAISHADMKNILPEMAQLQWTLPDCSTPVFKMETNGKIF